jgi:AbrB family looped-hinge helix DNA binding protein
MKEMITISSKGQVVIPKKIRKQADLKSGDQLLVEWDGNKLIFQKVTDKKTKPDVQLVRELLGKYETDANSSGNDVRKWRETLYGKIDDRQ